MGSLGLLAEKGSFLGIAFEILGPSQELTDSRKTPGVAFGYFQRKGSSELNVELPRLVSSSSNAPRREHCRNLSRDPYEDSQKRLAVDQLEIL